MKWKQTLHLIKEDYWNLWYYWQGTIRQWLFNNYPLFIRGHILEQYFFRVSSSICSDKDSCVYCGCSIKKGLFFANKGCGLKKLTPLNRKIFGTEVPCFEQMLSKKEWEKFKKSIIK